MLVPDGLSPTTLTEVECKVTFTACCRIDKTQPSCSTAIEAGAQEADVPPMPTSCSRGATLRLQILQLPDLAGELQQQPGGKPFILQIVAKIDGAPQVGSQVFSWRLLLALTLACCAGGRPLALACSRCPLVALACCAACWSVGLACSSPPAPWGGLLGAAEQPEGVALPDVA